MAFTQDKSALLSALEWLDRPAQIGLNLVTGNPGAAGRHALDFLSDIPDALIPGDAFKKQATPEDRVRGGDLFGVDRGRSPFLAAIADAATDTLANPLTYLGFGKGKGVQVLGKTVAGEGLTLDPLTLAGKAGRAGIDRLPETVRTPINRGLQATRETLGWLNPNEDVADTIARAKATGGNVGRAKEGVIRGMFAGTDIEDRKRAFRLINNYDRHGADGKATILGTDSGGRFGTWEEQDALLKDRLSKAPWTPEQKAKAYDLAAQALKNERTNYFEAVNDIRTMAPGDAPGVASDRATRRTNIEELGQAPLDYTHRDFDFDEVGADVSVPGMRASQASSLKKRRYQNTQELVDALNQEGPGAKSGVLEEDLAVSSAERAAQQAKGAKRAQIGFELINRGAKGELGPEVQAAVNRANASMQTAGAPAAANEFSTLSDARSRSLVDATIEELEKTSPDNARVLKTAWAGLQPRGMVTGALAKLNRLFKPSAVFGALGIPKPSAIPRNAVGFINQAAADPDLGWMQALTQIKRTPNALGYAFGTMGEKYTGKTLTRGFVHDNAELIDKAFAQSGGRAKQAIESLRTTRPDLAAMMEHGVLDSGFINAEQMLDPVLGQGLADRLLTKAGASDAVKQRVAGALEAPQAGFQGAEEYTRSRTFLDTRDRLGDKRAAAATRRAFYDYDAVSESNRALKDTIPFASFTTNAVRQNAQLLSRSPVIGTALAGFYGQDDEEPIYPYLQEQAHVKIGRDETGNPEYLAGLGLPIEALNLVPNLTGGSSVRSLGRDVERIVGGSAQPLAKTLYGAISGHDPYFSTPFGSYDKLPGNVKGGAAGRWYNLLAGTGLIQPIETPLNLAGKIADDRHSAGTKAIDLLTGANIVSVDPEVALQQQLTKALEADPTVQQSRSLYVRKGDADDETAALLKELQRLKQHARRERQAGGL